MEHSGKVPCLYHLLVTKLHNTTSPLLCGSDFCRSQDTGTALSPSIYSWVWDPSFLSVTIHHTSTLLKPQDPSLKSTVLLLCMDSGFKPIIIRLLKVYIPWLTNSPHNTPILAIWKPDSFPHLAKDIYLLNQASIPIGPVACQSSTSPALVPLFTSHFLVLGQDLFTFIWPEPDIQISWTVLPQGFPWSVFFHQSLAGNLENLNPVLSTFLQYVEHLFFELLLSTPIVSCVFWLTGDTWCSLLRSR